MHPAAPGLLKNRRKLTVCSSANSVLNGGVGSGGESAICCRFEPSTGGLRRDLRLRDSSAARRALICVRVAATSLSLLEIFLRLPMVHPFHLTLAIIEQQFLITFEEGIGVWHDAAICAHNRSEKMVACLTLMTNRERECDTVGDIVVLAGGSLDLLVSARHGAAAE
jgi:hypothetical protein